MKGNRFFAVLAVTALSVGALFAQDPAAPVFNMKTMPQDSSGNELNGTIWRTSGKIEDGKFVNDGGQSALVCRNNPALNVGTGDMTIVLTTTLKEKQAPRIGLVSKGAVGATSPGYSFQYDVANKKLCLCIGAGGERVFIYSKPIVLNDDQPHRVAVAVNRGDGTILFAIDGKVFKVTGNTLPGESLDCSNKLFIGSWEYGYCINGSIANVQLYKKAFSADELAKMTSAKEKQEEKKEE